jgi:hypothetical protein
MSRPTTVFMANGWYFDMPGLVTPRFQTLEGINRKTGTTDIVDGGDNIKYQFSDQIQEFGQITLARTRDGSVDDYTMDLLVTASLREGATYSGTLYKLNWRKRVFSIGFVGLMFIEDAHPTLETGSSEQYSQRFTAIVHEWLPPVPSLL